MSPSRNWRRYETVPIRRTNGMDTVRNYAGINWHGIACEVTMGMTPEQLRRIDTLVAEHVMGYKVDSWTPDGIGVMASQWTEGREWYTTAPHYSTDIAAAWEVVKKVSGRIAVYRNEQGDIFQAYVAEISAVAPTAPLAISLAALKAKGISTSEVSTHE